MVAFSIMIFVDDDWEKEILFNAGNMVGLMALT